MFPKGVVKRQFKKVNNQKRKAWKSYHIVDFNDLDTGTASKQDCVQEINQRVEFVKKYYHGQYDAVHKKVLCKLSKGFKIVDKLNLSLDALITIHETKPVKRKYYKKH